MNGWLVAIYSGAVVAYCGDMSNFSNPTAGFGLSFNDFSSSLCRVANLKYLKVVCVAHASHGRIARVTYQPLKII